jgi:hypothetical protein
VKKERQLSDEKGLGKKSKRQKQNTLTAWKKSRHILMGDRPLKRSAKQNEWEKHLPPTLIP